jgi:hypothetical protein
MHHELYLKNKLVRYKKEKNKIPSKLQAISAKYSAHTHLHFLLKNEVYVTSIVMLSRLYITQ